MYRRMQLIKVSNGTFLCLKVDFNPKLLWCVQPLVILCGIEKKVSGTDEIMCAASPLLCGKLVSYDLTIQVGKVYFRV